ncbi:MAG: hypothetical protein IT442_12340 [Phycisphaeraceae bacterium]|nr:hypothetical protein [Phycisphaeraceae bacterium]
MTDHVTIDHHGNASFSSMDVETADFNSAFDGTSTILGSARQRENGSVVVGRSVGPDDIVRLPGGMAVEASFAADHGFLVRNPDGSFSDVPGTAHSHAPTSAAGRSDTASPQDAPESDIEVAPSPDLDADHVAEGADMPAEPLAPELEQVIADADAVARPAAQAIMEQAIDQSGNVPDGSFELLARAQGVPVDTVRQNYESIRAGFEAQAADLVAAEGFDPAEFWAWANEPDSPQLGQLKEAVRQHVAYGHLRGYRALIRSAQAEIAESNPQALQNAKVLDGLNVYQDGSIFKVKLKTGHVVPLAEAIRAGAVVIRHTGKGSARSGRRA